MWTAKDNELLNEIAALKETIEYQRLLCVDPCGAKEYRYEDFIAEIAGCGLCKKGGEVFFGKGNINSDIVFIEDTPVILIEESEESRLFTKIVESVGLKRGDIFITSLIKCPLPKDSDMPLLEKGLLCEQFLIKGFERFFKAKLICIMGELSAQIFLSTNKDTSGLRGRFHSYKSGTTETRYAAVTYHPEVILRDQTKKRGVWEDMKMIKERLASLYNLTKS